MMKESSLHKESESRSSVAILHLIRGLDILNNLPKDQAVVGDQGWILIFDTPTLGPKWYIMESL